MVAIAGEAASGGIHLPDQSWYPLITASGLLVGGLSFAAYSLPGALVGVAILLVGVYLWALEGPGGYHVHPAESGGAAGHAPH
jgi:cytochrome c oxidase subunit 1